MADRSSRSSTWPRLKLRYAAGSGAHPIWRQAACAELGNDIALVGPFVDDLLADCVTGLGLEGADQLRIALRELITNAIEHGNLGLSYADKSSLLASGLFKQELERRRAEADREGRTVEVWVRRSDEAVMIQIRDAGVGFDWRGLPDPRAPVDILDDHGRGILLARLSVDHLEFNEAGNQVTIIKRIADRAAIASKNARGG
jgi:anti-sigma regulatory factor (Ser/Thr protein kinase)